MKKEAKNMQLVTAPRGAKLGKEAKVKKGGSGGVWIGICIKPQ